MNLGEYREHIKSNWQKNFKEIRRENFGKKYRRKRVTIAHKR